MAEVPGAPYEPFFTAQPTERPIQLRGVDAPPAAFGENIAHAITAFGGDVDKASGEVFDRAMALRRMQIDSNVRDLTTAYSNEVEQENGKFTTQLGNKAGPDALNAHLANVDQIRQKYAGIAQQQYGIFGANAFGAEASAMQRNIIRSASAWSFQQTRKAHTDSDTAALDAAADRVRNSADPATFDEELKGIAPTMTRLASTEGWGEQETARKQGIAETGLISAQIEGLVRKGDYNGAWAFYKSHENQIIGEIGGVNVRDRLLKTINDAENHRGGSDIGYAVSGGFAAYITRREIDKTAGVDPHLLGVFKQAQQDLEKQGIQITIGDKGGVRTQAEQDQMVARGVSKTYHSDHLTGRALDVVLRNPDGTPNYKDETKEKIIAQAMRRAASDLGVPLKPEIGWDPAHFGLTAEYDSSKAPKLPEESQQSKINRGNRYAENTYGDHNTDIGQYVTAHVVQNDNIQKSSDRETEFRARQTLTSSVFGLGATGQKPATTLDELFANGGEAARQAWHDADPTLQQAILDKMAKITKGENIQWTTKGMDRYHTLLYMEDHETNDFIRNNMIAEEGIPTRYIVDLMKRQEKALTRREADPGIAPVQRYIEEHYSRELAGLTTDQRKQYMGAVKSGIESFNDKWGHAPRTPEEFDLIHQFASSTSSEPGLFGRFLGDTNYNVWDQVPPTLYKEYQKKYPFANDEQLLMYYQRDSAAAMFNQYFGRYGKKGIGGA